MGSIGGLRADVLVIGGGPAGLAAAIAARLKGFDVAVVDAARPAIDKACGEGILPAGVSALHRLGVPLTDKTGFPIRGLRFIDGGAAMEALFPEARGLALRRTRLHEALVRRAADLGVRLLWGTPLRGPDDLTHFRWIVGADGAHSYVRREAGLDGPAPSGTRFGFRRHYRIATWTDMVEVYWGDRCQVYVTPVGVDEVGVALLSRDPHLRLEAALSEFPDLHRRLQNARPSSPERGAATVSRRLPRVCNTHIALVGDASGSVDAITGDGLTLAFQQAGALSEALAESDLGGYQVEHRRLMRRASGTEKLLLLLDRFPRLRGLIFRALAAESRIFPAIAAALLRPSEAGRPA